MRLTLKVSGLVLTIFLFALAWTALAQDETPISVGDTVNGTLDDETPRVLYTFEGDRDHGVTITLISTDFDAYLVLQNPAGDVVAEDDDSAGRLNSQIDITLPESGVYTIIATSLREFRSNGEFIATGDFTLSLESSSGGIVATATPTQFSGDLPAHAIAIGGSVNGSLSFDNPEEEYSFSASAGDVVTITLESLDFDSYLFLYDSSGFELQYDDDSAGNLNSRVGPYEIPADGDYTIRASSFGYVNNSESESGSYTLTLSAAEVRAIEYTQEISDEITATNPFFVYTFTAEQGDVISVSLNTSSASVYISLADEDDSFSRETFGGSDILGPITVASTGQYTLTVETYDPSEEAVFTILVDQVTPEEIAYNETVTTDFTGKSSRFYTFEGETGDTLNILVQSDGSVDTQIAVTDPSGFEFASDDDGGEGFDPELSGLILSQSGTYSLAVRPYITGDNGEISITIEDAGVASLDEGAQVVRISDKQYQGVVTFDGVAGETVRLSARALNGVRGEPTLEVRQDDVLLASNSIGMVSRLILEFEVPEDGPVKIIVEDFGFGSSVIELSIEHLAESP
jgi:hypothetical protein